MAFVDDLNYWDGGRAAQVSANQATPVEEYAAGGNAPMLIVQGRDDRTAPPENGEILKQRYGDRITLVNLADAGHMMGMEKPAETATAIIAFLRLHPISR